MNVSYFVLFFLNCISKHSENLIKMLLKQKGSSNNERLPKCTLGFERLMATGCTDSSCSFINLGLFPLGLHLAKWVLQKN